MIEKTTNKLQTGLIIEIVALAVLTFMGIFSETSLNIAYSTLMNEFQKTASVIQWLTTGYLLVLSVAIPVSPFLVRKFSTKRLFQTAVFTFLAGTIVGAIAPNFELLLLGRLIMAIGTGISLPLLTNIVLEQAPIAQRGFLLGIVGLVTNFAPAIGPVFGGIIMEYLNWHWIFILMLPVVLFSIVAGSLSITDIRKGEDAVVDVPSVFLTSIGLSGIVVALSVSGDWNWDYRVWLLLAIGIASMAFFVIRQLRIDKPLIQVRVFRYPLFSTGMGMIMISQIVVMSFAFLLPILLQKGMECTSMQAALILLPGAIINGVMSPMTGVLLRRHKIAVFLIPGFLLLCSIPLVFVLADYSVSLILVCYAVFMFGGSLIQVPAQTNTLNQLPPSNNADGSAIMNTLQQVSGAVGTALASSFLTAGSSSFLSKGLTIEQSYLNGFRESIGFFLGLAVIGTILAVFTWQAAMKSSRK